MEKLTKRKAFNFYRSYFDVFNELNDTDKLTFIKSLLNKQFLDVDPTSLKGMAKFAWVSQQNNIEQQGLLPLRKGGLIPLPYKRKRKRKRKRKKSIMLLLRKRVLILLNYFY